MVRYLLWSPARVRVDSTNLPDLGGLAGESAANADITHAARTAANFVIVGSGAPLLIVPQPSGAGFPLALCCRECLFGLLISIGCN